MSKLRCKEVISRLDAFVEGELAEPEEQVVREHLAGCATCRRERDRIARAMGALHSVARPAVPEGVRRGLYARIAELEARRLRPAFLRPLAVGLAAVLLVAAGAAWVQFSPNSREDRERRSAVTRPVRPALSHTDPIGPRLAMVQPAPPPEPSGAKQSSVEPNAKTVSGSAVRTPKRSTHYRKTAPAPIPESFLDVADSRGITARDLIEARSGMPITLQTPPLPLDGDGQPVVQHRPRAVRPPELRTAETLNERVRIGERVTELHGVAQWDENGRLRTMHVRAETVEDETAPGTASTGGAGG